MKGHSTSFPASAFSIWGWVPILVLAGYVWVRQKVADLRRR